MLKQKFKSYSKKYLYACDIGHISYFQLIFENIDEGLNVSLVTDPLLEVVKCRYNWNEGYQSYIEDSYIKIKLDPAPSAISIGIVAEWDIQGYSDCIRSLAYQVTGQFKNIEISLFIEAV